VIAHDSGRGGHFARAIARVAPGASVEQVQAQIDAVQDRLAREFPETNTGQRGRVEPLQKAIAGDTSAVLLTLAITVGLVLLIACANVANLLLARGTVRQREIAIRGALGASRARVVRQLLTENLMLALLAAGLGSLLATAAVQAIPRWIADELPTVIAPRPDLRVLAFTIALSCATVLLFGLVPAILASRRDVRSSLVEGTPGAGGRLRRIQSVLLIGEAALAVLLLVGATLLVESLVRLQRVDPGFATDHVLTFRVGLPRTRYPSGIGGATFFASAVERLSALPGVRASGGVNIAPLTQRWSCDSFGLDDRPAPTPGTEPCAENRVVTPQYFEAMGIPLRQGRLLNASDTREARRVIVISEAMAREYWPDGNALGKRFKWGSVASDQPWLTIVGVVGNVRTYDLAEPAAPDVYVPLQQSGATAMTIAVRAPRDPATLAAEVRGAIATLDPALAISETFSTSELVARSTALPRFRTQVLTTLAIVALALAVVGVYGVLSFFVAQRRREIGIRLALGATPRGITRFVLRTGLAATAIGCVIGVVAALPLMKLLREQLFEVSPSDPLAFIAAPGLLLVTALIACYVPARRATRLEPALTIRPD
jgi:putative ABC transport system permease protein